MRALGPAASLVLMAIFSWCLGAMFAVAWLWLFGFQLSAWQARALVIAFAAMGLVFGLVQAMRRNARAGDAA